MYRAQRSSSNGAKEQLQQGAKEQQKGANCSSSFYSVTNRFVIVFSVTNRLRTIRSFHLNGWDVQSIQLVHVPLSSAVLGTQLGKVCYVV